MVSGIADAIAKRVAQRTRRAWRVDERAVETKLQSSVLRCANQVDNKRIAVGVAVIGEYACASIVVTTAVA